MTDDHSILALELGKPATISDDDCEVDLPMAMDDTHVQSERSWAPPSMVQPNSPFLTTLRVVREMSNLLNVIKSPVLSPATLQSCDTQFNHCLAAFPSHHQIQRTEHLEPCSVLPMIYLQNARFILHRHNLTILGAPEVRTAALESCGLIARDTAQLLSRCLTDLPSSPHQHSPTPHTGGTRLITAVSTSLCTHIWRCTLLLCLRGDFEAALTCARVSATFGDARPINAACGKYMAFFLDRLIQKSHHEPRVNYDNDEELLAYASGDLQGSIEHSWIWQGGESICHQPLQSPNGSKSIIGDEDLSPEADLDQQFGRAGWKRLLETLDRLVRDLQQDQRQGHFLSPLQGENTHRASSHGAGRSQGIPPGSNRISIANII